MGEYVNAVIASDEHITLLGMYSFHAVLLAILQAVTRLITTSLFFCHTPSPQIVLSVDQAVECPALFCSLGHGPARGFQPPQGKLLALLAHVFGNARGGK